MKNNFISRANAQCVSSKAYHFSALLEINHRSDAKLTRIIQNGRQEFHEYNF
jgi:hypothetical protein